MVRQTCKCILYVCCFLLVACSSDIDGLEEEERFPEEEIVEEIEEELDSGDNLLQNGDCESWWTMFTPYDFLNQWFCHNNYNVKQESKIVYEGKFSARMSAYKGETAIVNQRIEVTPNHRLRIRFHYYIEEWKNNGARMYCYFRTTSTQNISNTVLNEIYDKKTIKIIRGGGYGASFFPSELGVWQTFDYTITTPSIANYFVFEIHSYHETTIYIDDCCVVDMDME